MQLAAKLARIRIGDDVFQSGDQVLTSSINLELGEDQRSSSCRFTVNDPGLKIGAKYREISVTQGGIIVPSDLLKAPATGAGPAPVGSTPVTTTLGEGGADVPLAIVKECLRQGVSDPVKIAFILATAQGESGFKYDAYNPESSNPNVPDKRYGGRGLVQITQKYNYEYFGKILNIDLVGNPDLAFRPDVALYLLVAGIKRGWCGKGGLDKFVTGPGSIATAYTSIQGGVWGSRYQGYFDSWLQKVPALIQQAGGTAAPAPTPATPPLTPTTTPAPTAPVQAAPTVEASQKGTEIIIELAVGWGLTFKDAIAFHFIHTGTDTSWDKNGAQITTFEGKSIRWLLTRTPVTESFQGMTFKQYLESRCKAFGLKLEMEGSGLNYEHLSQDGQTHLELILREARRIGFSVKEGIGKDSGKLIVKPSARPEFTNFIIDEEVLIKPAKFTDKARAGTTPQPAATIASPGTGVPETTAAANRETGAIAQTKPQEAAGSGAAPGASNAVPGPAIAPVGGTVRPAAPTATAATTPPSTPAGPSTTETKTDEPRRTTRADGTVVTIARETTTKTESGKITRTITTRTSTQPTSGTPTLETTVETITITDSGRAIVRVVTPFLGEPVTSTKNEPLTAEDKRLLELSKKLVAEKAAGQPTAGAFGLPNQAMGAIDLLDGRAEAQVIADESKRVKGYEDSYTLVMNMETLAIVPGQIVALSKRLFPDAFATEKRVGGVQHNFQDGTTSISTYTPQAPPPDAAGVTQFASPAMPLAPGGFIFPVPKGATTIGDGYGTRARKDPNYRHTILDVTAPAGTPAVAMADGVVSRLAPNNGGAGNMMVITHGGGYQATYMHGLAGNPFIVGVGPVKQGQPIFRIGTTGGSSGNHLHLKFTLNGNYCLLSKVGLDVLKIGLPLHQFNKTCNQY